MRIIISKLDGDATISIFNKQMKLIHTEGFTGKVTSGEYEREIPVSIKEYLFSQVVVSGEIDYRVSE